jgi:hypothetical protein
MSGALAIVAVLIEAKFLNDLVATAFGPKRPS